MVRIGRSGESQRWWLITRDSAVYAQVAGPMAVVDVRLVLPTDGADSLRYVVAVTVDGKPSDWRALTAVRDTRVQIAGAYLGDRDRVELSLPPGLHEVGVQLAAGHSSALVTRIRVPEERDDGVDDE